MDFPLFNQKNYPEELGIGAGYTVAQYGCAMVDVASICRWFGKQTDPHELNQALIRVNGYVSNSVGALDILVWGAITQVYSDISLAFCNSYPTFPADMGLIDNQLARKMPVIVGVSFNHNSNETKPTHYVCIFKKNDDGTYQGMDPWFGDSFVFDKRYAVNGMSVPQCILQAVSYNGPIPQDSVQIDNEQIIKDLSKARDTNWALYQSETAKTKELTDALQKQNIDTELKIKQYEQNLADLTTTVKQLTDENSGLKIQIKQVNDSNISISKLYHDKCQEDSTAIDEGIKAQKALDIRNAQLLKIASMLNTSSDIDRILEELSLIMKSHQEVVKNSVNYLSEFLAKLGLIKKEVKHE